MASSDNMLKRNLQEERDRRFPSNATPVHKTPQSLQDLFIPVEERGKTPITQDKYRVKEKPILVEWERQVRLFLRQLSPSHGHVVSAMMILEWVTGKSYNELLEEKKRPNAHLRHINDLLRYYFGDCFNTHIAGRKVKKAYRVKPGYYIKRHRPRSITLYVEYTNGTLEA